MGVILDHPSPNHGARRAAIDMLIVHYTGMTSARAALARLSDPQAKVSAHYLIDEDGSTYRLVSDDRRAWHAGDSSWAGESDVNSRSIGIELVNPGHEFGYRRFPNAQMTALEDLGRRLLKAHRIPAAHVLGHSDVAPLRKQDPGELFDWARLARHGIGLWPGPIDLPETDTVFERGDRDPRIARAQRRFARFGYPVPQSGALDPTTAAVITAFQRHFRPTRVDGLLDCETVARLEAVLRRLD
jgi:N-acetylmuramoyl-L-alanine amidase